MARRERHGNVIQNFVTCQRASFELVDCVAAAALLSLTAVVSDVLLFFTCTAQLVVTVRFCHFCLKCLYSNAKLSVQMLKYYFEKTEK